MKSVLKEATALQSEAVTKQADLSFLNDPLWAFHYLAPDGDYVLCDANAGHDEGGFAEARLRGLMAVEVSRLESLLQEEKLVDACLTAIDSLSDAPKYIKKLAKKAGFKHLDKMSLMWPNEDARELFAGVKDWQHAALITSFCSELAAECLAAIAEPEGVDPYFYGLGEDATPDEVVNHLLPIATKLAVFHQLWVAKHLPRVARDAARAAKNNAS